jgi:phage shock protein C
MSVLSKPFYLNKRSAKLAGVCSGIAEYTGWNVNMIRIATLIGTIVAWGGLALIYILIAWLAEPKPFA